MLIHCSIKARARILGGQGTTGLAVDVTRHRARLVQFESVIIERGHLTERLTGEVGRLLVLALGEVDQDELEGRVRLVQGHQDFAGTGTGRMSENFHPTKLPRPRAESAF